jgi:hypothetical protein
LKVGFCQRGFILRQGTRRPGRPASAKKKSADSEQR